MMMIIVYYCLTINSNQMRFMDDIFYKYLFITHSITASAAHFIHTIRFECKTAKQARIPATEIARKLLYSYRNGEKCDVNLSAQTARCRYIHSHINRDYMCKYMLKYYVHALTIVDKVPHLTL